MSQSPRTYGLASSVWMVVAFLCAIFLQGMVMEQHERRQIFVPEHLREPTPWWPLYLAVLCFCLSFAAEIIYQLRRLNDNVERRWPARRSESQEQGPQPASGSSDWDRTLSHVHQADAETESVSLESIRLDLLARFDRLWAWIKKSFGG